MMTPNEQQGGDHDRGASTESFCRLSKLLACAEATAELQLAAVDSDARAATDVDAAELWRDLTSSAYGVVHEFFAGASCYLVLAPRCSAARRHVDERRLNILQAVLAGSPQNNVAIDLRLAPSTVALASKQALEAFGAHDRPSRAHPLLMMAAVASRESSIAMVRSSRFTVREQLLRVVAIRRPDTHLAKVLPVAELAVTRKLVDGCTYAEIGAERRTSRRTVANQIAAVFRRLRVSGRNELVRRLLIDERLVRLLPTLADTTPPAHGPPAASGDSWLATRRSA